MVLILGGWVPWAVVLDGGAAWVVEEGLAALLGMEEEGKLAGRG